MHDYEVTAGSDEAPLESNSSTMMRKREIKLET
jgi:hypothetical protein